MKPDLALVGAGYWGKNLARNFLALKALRTLCDASVEVLGSYGVEYDDVLKAGSFEAVLEDAAISKVVIATPAATHFALAKQALQADKDVFVEKPLCLEVAEAEELVALAADRNRILMVGHLLQYHPMVERLSALLADGELGRLHYVSSHRLNLGKIRREENALWSFAPHDISVILSLTGQQPEQVSCFGEAYLTKNVADVTLTSLRFNGSIRAHVYVSWLNPFKEQKLTVVGSNAMAVFDDTRPWAEKLMLFRDPLRWTQGQTPVPNPGNGEPVAVPESEPLRNECAHFLACCRERRTPRTDGREGLRVLRVLRAAQASLERSGERVDPTDAVGPAPYYVHSTAVVDAGATIGAGTKIWHFAHVSAGSQIGEKCILGQNTFVAPGVTIGNNVKVQNNVAIYTGTVIEEDVFLGPSCVLTNVTNPRSQVNRHDLYERTVIRRGATIGANATIVCGITLGRYCFVAAGALVAKDVPDYALMQGVPARQVGWMSRHGHRLTPDAAGVLMCPETGYRYEEIAPGQLQCVDLPEEEALPQSLRQGMKTYDQLKTSRAKVPAER
jgi:UDP-2-acetamido-3-amino-2,3-dideoxy-glucuronate N-acetyltransferase